MNFPEAKSDKSEVDVDVDDRVRWREVSCCDDSEKRVRTRRWGDETRNVWLANGESMSS